MRHFTAYAAGISELEPPHFALYAYSGALIWVSTFIGLGYFLGERWKAVRGEHPRLPARYMSIAIAVCAYRVLRMVEVDPETKALIASAVATTTTAPITLYQSQEIS